MTISNSGAPHTRRSGFINAVLRKATRQKAPVFRIANDEIGSLALKYSHPRWVAERFVATFGRIDAETLMAADNEAAPTAIRLNLARTPREEILARLMSDGLEVAAEGRFPETLILNGSPQMESGSFREGLFHVQSEASQIIARMLAPAPGAVVVDCSAAPGGKATHLAEIVGGPDPHPLPLREAGPERERGNVIALDLNFAGLRTTRSIAKRLGHANLLTSVPILLERFRYGPRASTTCCSMRRAQGPARSGSIRRFGGVKPTDPERMARLQMAMLRNAAAVLRPGGAIVYSVCSLMPEEGPGVVAQFLAENPQYEIDVHPSVQTQIADLLCEDGTLLTRPDRSGLDGFFAARIVRH